MHTKGDYQNSYHNNLKIASILPIFDLPSVYYHCSHTNGKQLKTNVIYKLIFSKQHFS